MKEFNDNKRYKRKTRASSLQTRTRWCVEGVIVEIIELSIKTETDENGKFVFDNIKVGTYTVKISKDAYESRTINDIAIASAQETELTIPADVPAKTFAGEIKTKIK